MHDRVRPTSATPLGVALLLLACVVAIVLGPDSPSGAAVPAAAQPGGALDWHSCGDHGAECSRLEVPLDWSKPDGPKIYVGVTALAPEDPAHRLGVLFFNPGGPGGGTRAIVRDSAAEYFPPALRRRFEIVGVDPRGVAPGRPAVSCALPTRSARLSITPASAAGYRRLLAYERRVGRSCVAGTGPLLGHVDMVSTARDLDAVRAALGVEKVSWLGVSYGSLLGATYAHLFPTHVRAAVLDGALDHTVGPARLALDEAHSTEGEFAAFARWCEADASCALHGRDVAVVYRGLLARARRHPIPALGIPAGVSAAQIGFGTYGLMEIGERWPLLAELIRDATAGHPNAAIFARAGVPENGAYRATVCQDFPSDIHDYAEFRGLLARLWRAAPITGPYVEGWDVATGCMAWPVPSRNRWGRVLVTGTPPILVVGGAHDPSTPERWARGLASQIKGSRLLLWDGSGHTGYFNDPSVKAREVAYLLDPKAPVPGTVGR